MRPWALLLLLLGALRSGGAAAPARNVLLLLGECGPARTPLPGAGRWGHPGDGREGRSGAPPHPLRSTGQGTRSPGMLPVSSVSPAPGRGTSPG